ncbi:hypothetical protein NDU88_005370 [Pleurodeles waltl]|uniref:Uncharacterized protein n=1 Tax=Pleurodeles waltl TaxID=8319 RepID=A0AAV7VJS9_PLEWA|nr:hypothetical protein NDU88_005370 [Pleurodeles waltl]
MDSTEAQLKTFSETDQLITNTLLHMESRLKWLSPKREDPENNNCTENIPIENLKAEIKGADVTQHVIELLLETNGKETKDTIAMESTRNETLQ